MYNSAFTPSGDTVLVDASGPAFVGLPRSNIGATSYRIRNVTSSAAYFAWRPSNATGTVPTGMAATAPVVGTPAINTIGMISTSVEVFVLPQNCWFIASASATFEVTPGEGI